MQDNTISRLILLYRAALNLSKSKILECLCRKTFQCSNIRKFSNKQKKRNENVNILHYRMVQRFLYKESRRQRNISSHLRASKIMQNRERGAVRIGHSPGGSCRSRSHVSSTRMGRHLEKALRGLYIMNILC